MHNNRKMVTAFRVLTAIACLAYISVFLVNIPIYYKRMATECISNTCLAAPGPPPGKEALYLIGMNEMFYALFYTVVECTFILTFLIAALIIFIKRGNDVMGILGALLLVGFGTTFPSMMSIVAENNPPLLYFNGAMIFLGWMSLSIFFLLFPNGRFAPKWASWALVPLILLFAVGFIEEMPLWVGFLRIVTVFVLLLFSQIYRYRKVSSVVERQQTKWVVYGLSVAVTGFLLTVFLPLALNPRIYEEGSPAFFMIFNSLVYLFLLLIPISLTFALLRRRLWDIDPLLNKTLLYVVMSAVVVGIYGAVVWYLSNVFQTDDNVIVSIVATAIAAVSFSPIKERLQQTIIRRIYGEQDNPFFVLALVGKKIQELQTPEQILDQVARTLKELMRLPYASINVLQNDREVTLAQYGVEQKETHALPITYRGTILGSLNVAPRTPGERLTKSDQRLFDVLIQQLGPLLQDLQATMDLKSLNSDLQLSRERLVLAREEERQTMRRNLHDDLAPRLAALAYTAAAAEELVDRDPERVKRLLAEHQQMILGTVADIRRLVYDLRPPTIDELGLVEAIRQRVQDIASTVKGLDESSESQQTSVSFDVPARMPELPAAVEVAVYRIVTESVVNVFRHAKAMNCSISLRADRNVLQLEVCDDGIGFSGIRKASTTGGLGVPSMMERAAELGGECRIERGIHRGTRVHAWVPLTEYDLEEAT